MLGFVFIIIIIFFLSETVDCLYPVVKDGVHIAVCHNKDLLRSFFDHLAMNLSKKNHIVMGNYFPSENIVMNVGGGLRKTCVTIIFCLWGSFLYYVICGGLRSKKFLYGVCVTSGS